MSISKVWRDSTLSFIYSLCCTRPGPVLNQDFLFDLPRLYASSLAGILVSFLTLSTFLREEIELMISEAQLLQVVMPLWLDYMS